MASYGHATPSLIVAKKLRATTVNILLLSVPRLRLCLLNVVGRRGILADCGDDGRRLDDVVRGSGGAADPFAAVLAKAKHVPGKLMIQSPVSNELVGRQMAFTYKVIMTETQTGDDLPWVTFC